MGLSEHQKRQVSTSDGRWRCPYCGRFRKLADFEDQDPHKAYGEFLVSVLPMCSDCSKKGRKLYEDAPEEDPWPR